MHAIPELRSILLAACAALAVGCASTPSAGPAADINEEVLRDTDTDLLFATEFPVTSKADALLRADEARKAGDLDKALFFYVKALKFDPRDADLLAAIGRLHQYRGNPELAVRAYSLALDARPDFVSVLEARGLILLVHDRDERAREDLARTVELAPGQWRAYNGLGLLADREDDHAAAIAYYDRALGLNPASGDVLNNRGYSKFLAGDLDGAEADLGLAARKFGHRQAWVNLGTLYARQGLYERAVESLQEVLPEAEAFNKVAEASMEQGDFGTAEHLLERAIRVSPIYFPAAEDNLVQLKLKTGGG